MKYADAQQDLLTVTDLARILRCGRTKAWEIVHSNDIRTVRVGRLVRLEKNAVEEFIEKNRQ